MPPKKKEEPVEKPVLGRFKSNLKVTIAARFVRVNFACLSVHATVSSSQSVGQLKSWATRMARIKMACVCMCADGNCGFAECWQEYFVQHFGQSVDTC